VRSILGSPLPGAYWVFFAKQGDPTSVGVFRLAHGPGDRLWVAPCDRRYFIGGSDARVIMGNDEAALLRLWREKRGELEPEDFSGNLTPRN
jgi:hypothetical protein